MDRFNRNLVRFIQRKLKKRQIVKMSNSKTIAILLPTIEKTSLF